MPEFEGIKPDAWCPVQIYYPSGMGRMPKFERIKFGGSHYQTATAAKHPQLLASAHRPHRLSKVYS